MGDAPEAGRTAARGRRGKRESHSRRAERRKAFFFRGESGTGTRVLPQPGRKEREEERGLQASRPPPPLLVRTGSLRFTVTDPSRSRRRQRGGGGPAAWEGFFSAMGNLLFRGGGSFQKGRSDGDNNASPAKAAADLRDIARSVQSLSTERDDAEPPPPPRRCLRWADRKVDGWMERGRGEDDADRRVCAR